MRACIVFFCIGDEIVHLRGVGLGYDSLFTIHYQLPAPGTNIVRVPAL